LKGRYSEVAQEISSPKAIPYGTQVRLKDGILPHLLFREWEFRGVERGKLVLYEKGRGALILVSIQDIDWDGLNNQGKGSESPKRESETNV
jgi:hypothetical protein